MNHKKRCCSCNTTAQQYCGEIRGCHSRRTGPCSAVPHRASAFSGLRPTRNHESSLCHPPSDLPATDGSQLRIGNQLEAPPRLGGFYGSTRQILAQQQFACSAQGRAGTASKMLLAHVCIAPQQRRRGRGVRNVPAGRVWRGQVRPAAPARRGGAPRPLAVGGSCRLAGSRGRPGEPGPPGPCSRPGSAAGAAPPRSPAHNPKIPKPQIMISQPRSSPLTLNPVCFRTNSALTWIRIGL